MTIERNGGNLLISIICCYSRKEALQSMLQASIKNQSIEFETIFIDNTRNEFLSAANALNFGFKQSRGQYIIFVHQDISFEDPYFLQKIINNIDLLGGNVIIGAAGIKCAKSIYSNITHGDKKTIVGKHRVETPEKVQTLDEVLIGVKREVFEKFYFDETTCDNWHLYGVDLCLTAAEQGVDSYVIPLSFYHKSSGKVDSDYMRSLGEVIKKHKKNFKTIHTTISSINTLIYQKNIYNFIYRSKQYWSPKIKKF